VPLFPCARSGDFVGVGEYGMNLNDVLPSPRVLLHRNGPFQLKTHEMRVAWWDSEMHLEDGASKIRDMPF
jgi:hypothetical protein